MAITQLPVGNVDRKLHFNHHQIPGKNMQNIWTCQVWHVHLNQRKRQSMTLTNGLPNDKEWTSCLRDFLLYLEVKHVVIFVQESEKSSKVCYFQFLFKYFIFQIKVQDCKEPWYTWLRLASTPGWSLWMGIKRFSIYFKPEIKLHLFL